MAPGPRGFATWALLDIVVGYTSPTSIGPSGSPTSELVDPGPVARARTLSIVAEMSLATIAPPGRARCCSRLR